MTQLAPIQHDQVLAVALEGKPFKEIAAAVGLTINALWRAMEIDAHFRSKVIQARDVGIDVMVDEIMTIAKDAAIPVDRARLLCDNIKWIAARRAHRRYGDRLDVNVSGTIDLGSTLLEARKRTLQPMSNQQQDEIAQPIDAEWESVPETTDKESAGALPSIFD